MVRMAIALFLVFMGSAMAEEGFLPYDSDVGLTGMVVFDPHADGVPDTVLFKLDNTVNVGGSPMDDQNGRTFRDVTVMQVIPRDEHVQNRLRAFAKSRLNIRGWLSRPISPGQRTDVVLNATEVEPVKANGSP